eukprot:scaffold302_cov397-Prasinococcus_capsulatus_cf.AAC.20
MSQNTGVAPTSNTASPVLIHVKSVQQGVTQYRRQHLPGTMTSSPARMPRAIKATSNASVPEDTATQ